MMGSRKTQAEWNLISEKKGKLDREQVLAIKRGLEKGERVADLAMLYCVNELTITRIRDGKTWGWLKTEDDFYMRSVVVTEQDEKEAAESLAKLMGMMGEKREADTVGDRLVGELEQTGKNRFGL
jgi:hypothetical protein